MEKALLPVENVVTGDKNEVRSMYSSTYTLGTYNLQAVSHVMKRRRIQSI